MSVKQISFEGMRPDWYAGNQYLPRLFRNCLAGKDEYCFSGFPRQWIPVFEWYGVKWFESIEPCDYLPFFSDLTENDLLEIVARSRKEGILRTMVESCSMLDPIISDFLYIVDNSRSLSQKVINDELEGLAADRNIGKKKRLLLNGWQSYGRPSIRHLDRKVKEIRKNPTQELAILLPCSLRRPYGESKTHRRIYKILNSEGYSIDNAHRIVVSSIGVVPEETWYEPQVLSYNTGVPDVYRVLRLLRDFFSRNKYSLVIDCLQFQPYSDLLSILKNEGIIESIKRIKVPKKRQFFLRG